MKIRGRLRGSYVDQSIGQIREGYDLDPEARKTAVQEGLYVVVTAGRVRPVADGRAVGPWEQVDL